MGLQKSAILDQIFSKMSWWNEIKELLIDLSFHPNTHKHAHTHKIQENYALGYDSISFSFSRFFFSLSLLKYQHYSWPRLSRHWQQNTFCHAHRRLIHIIALWNPSQQDAIFMWFHFVRIRMHSKPLEFVCCLKKEQLAVNSRRAVFLCLYAKTMWAKGNHPTKG